MLLPGLLTHMEATFRACPDIPAVRFLATLWEFVQKYDYLSIAQKKALLLQAVTLFAAGKDGVLGTDDDVLPKTLLENLHMLLEKNLVEDTLSLFQELRTGTWNAQKVGQHAVGCWNFWSACLPPPKK